MFIPAKTLIPNTTTFPKLYIRLLKPKNRTNGPKNIAKGSITQLDRALLEVRRLGNGPLDLLHCGARVPDHRLRDELGASGRSGNGVR